jgi:nitrite reductase/ring-hydroxylating ferredoxin subunit
VSESGPPASGGRILATRREAFARLFGLAGASSIGAQTTGCASEPVGPLPARLPLSALPPNGRLRVLHRGDPVELRREGETVRARSLLCTHQGCEVRWRPDLDRYRCPCHQGLFDSSGQPFSGPPQRPLAEIQVRVEGGEIVVGEGSPAEPGSGT